MIKNQATCQQESEVFRAYMDKQNYWEKRLGRLLCLCTGAPLLFMLALKKGAAWKIGGIYMYSVVFNAIYDSGIYLQFFLNGPSSMRKILALDEEKSFSAI